MRGWLRTRLFDQLPLAACVIDEERRVVEANEAFGDLFGPWQARRCYEAVKRRDDECPDCRAPRVLADGKVRVVDQPCVARDGRTTAYSVRLASLVGAPGDAGFVLATFTDVHEARMLAEECRTLFDGVPCFLTVIDRDYRIVQSNLHFDETFGEGAGRACHEAYARSGARCPDCPAALTFRDGGIHQGSRTGTSHDGRPVHYVVSTAPLGDGPDQVIEMSIDLTEQRRLEREKVEAERLALVGETVAATAHSIKNILSGLEGGIYLVDSGLERGEDGRVRQGWEMVGRHIGGISRLAHEMLAFSKGRKLEPSIVDPRALAAGVVELFRPRAAESGIELLSDLGPHVADACLDKAQLEEALVNLVTNAIDACRARGVGGGRIDVRVGEEGDALVFEVVDDGCGMDEETRRRIFTRFFTTKDSQGTGLGLLSVRRTVLEHGGTVGVTSSAGAGSRFRLRLPRDRLPQPVSGSGDNNPPPAGPDGRGPA